MISKEKVRKSAAMNGDATSCDLIMQAVARLKAELDDVEDNYATPPKGAETKPSATSPVPWRDLTNRPPPHPAVPKARCQQVEHVARGSQGQFTSQEIRQARYILRGSNTMLGQSLLPYPRERELIMIPFRSYSPSTSGSQLGFAPQSTKMLHEM